jgi:hypothetical protein
MRKTIALLAAATVVSALSMAPPADGSAPRHHLTYAVYGDAPYGTSPTDTSEFLATPAFIDSVNADPDVSLVAHVGDIHSGKQFCTEAYDKSVASLWTRYDDPLVYTPGDNEWTDCHKAAEGGGTYDSNTQQIKYVTDPATGLPIDYASGNPVANLDLIRSIFFPAPGQTLGGGHMRVLSQAQLPNPLHPADRNYVENVMWSSDDVLFVTLDVPGGSNNDTDPWYGAPAMSPQQAQEVSDRTGADLRWLNDAFTIAQLTRMKSVMIMVQADMWDLDGKTTDHLAAYDSLVDSIATHTTSYGRPVLLINGDSHIYRSDNPLSPTAPCVIEGAGGVEGPCASANPNHPGYDVSNFHRIVVHGSTFPLEWLKLTIDPGAHGTGSNAFGPYAWTRMP